MTCNGNGVDLVCFASILFECGGRLQIHCSWSALNSVSRCICAEREFGINLKQLSALLRVGSVLDSLYKLMLTLCGLSSARMIQPLTQGCAWGRGTPRLALVLTRSCSLSNSGWSVSSYSFMLNRGASCLVEWECVPQFRTVTSRKYIRGIRRYHLW